MKKIVLATILGGAFLLIGCGSNNSSFNDNTKTKTAIVGETVTVSSGDTLKQSDDSEIIIRHIIDKNTKEIEVLKGTVTLIKGSYSAE